MAKNQAELEERLDGLFAGADGCMNVAGNLMHSGDWESAENYLRAAAMLLQMYGELSEEQEEEKTDFTLVLTAAGEKKIDVIKEVRTITGLGLKEALDLVKGAPKTVKEGLSKEDAGQFAGMLRAVGATVELRSPHVCAEVN